LSCDFADAIRENLPDIDFILAGWEIDPSERPLHAAYLFVQGCVVSIKGDTKDDFLSKPWFGEIYRVVQRWYVERYGDRLRGARRQALTGVVLFLNSVFRVDVPIVTTEPGPERLQQWVCFPDEVLPAERPLEWLTAPPRVDNLKPSACRELEEKVRWVANAIRECNRGVVTATKTDAEMEALATTVPEHISRGAELILGARNVRGLAVWELHLAVEKTFKLLLRQCGLQPAKIHDLVELAALAEKHGLQTLPRQSLSLLPSGSEAIASRYGEAPPVALGRLVEIYQAALTVCSSCCRTLARRLTTRNMRYLIRALPFVAGGRGDINEAS
jgi:HEPN domain-containing protein